MLCWRRLTSIPRATEDLTIELHKKKEGVMKYIVFGYTPDKFEKMSEIERNAMFDECFTYDDELRKNGHWAFGEAVQPSSATMTVSARNGKVAVTDGPYAETKEQLGGIMVLEARDLNHAIQLISRHPALKMGTPFEIRPVFSMDEIMRESEQRRGKVASR
jgi:hypothetical protein